MKKLIPIILLFSLMMVGCKNQKANHTLLTATQDNGERLVLTKEDVSAGSHHTGHAKIFGKYVSGYNTAVLNAIDMVQSTAMDGGGYFIGITATPPESPIGYDLELFNKPLLKAPRTTSYCSGSSYTVFIESLNLIFKNTSNTLSDARYESLRMQEPDGGRREDGVKFWGKWNDDGYGNHFALVQYSEMGKIINPVHARPGDFLNISWKNGGGHSVVFLGWYINEENEKCLVYWSSQKSTNGLGNSIVPISRIQEVMFVRLTSPENLFTFDVHKEVNRSVQGHSIDW